MIQTPVGARCRECAHLRRPPLYDVGSVHYVRALGVGLGLALVVGLAWTGINLLIGGILSLLIGIGAGYIIGEVISQAVNRKRSTGLQLIAGLTVVLAFLAHNFFVVLFAYLQVTSLEGALIGISMEAAVRGLLNSLSNLYGLAALGIALYLAIIRVR